MQAPQQEIVNMRKATPMDLVAEAAVKEATALDVPTQFEMDKPRHATWVTMHPDKIATCQFSEGCHMADEEEDKRDATETKVEDLVPCAGTCCMFTSCYCNCPGMIGCSVDGIFCCFQGRGSCCKALTCEKDDRRCCACFEGQTFLIVPQPKCVEYQTQCCCLDHRIAIPCTDSVPCLVNLLGITCCADFGVKCGACQSIGSLIPRLKPDA